MAKLTRFSRTVCAALSAELEAALQGVASRHGISIKAGNGRFSAETYTLKVECAVLNADGVAASRERKDFVDMAEFIGLKAEDLDKVIDYGDSGKFQIMGYLIRSRKNPILAKRVKDGKMYGLPVRGVQRALGREVSNGR